MGRRLRCKDDGIGDVGRFEEPDLTAAGVELLSLVRACCLLQQFSRNRARLYAGDADVVLLAD